MTASEARMFEAMERDVAEVVLPCGCPRGISEDIRGHNPMTCSAWVRREATPVEWEYGTGTCEQWQIHHLCNYWAERRWQPVQVFPVSPESVRLPDRVGDENGQLRPAHRPFMILFRRPILDEGDDDA